MSTRRYLAVLAFVLGVSACSNAETPEQEMEAATSLVAGGESEAATEPRYFGIVDGVTAPELEAEPDPEPTAEEARDVDPAWAAAERQLAEDLDRGSDTSAALALERDLYTVDEGCREKVPSLEDSVRSYLESKPELVAELANLVASD